MFDVSSPKFMMVVIVQCVAVALLYFSVRYLSFESSYIVNVNSGARKAEWYLESLHRDKSETDLKIFNAHSPETVSNDTTSMKIILDWTGFYGTSLDRYWEKGQEHCKARCSVLNDKKLLNKADAIIFHPRDISITNLPTHQSQSQIFVLFNQEPPTQTGNALETLPANFFNWTMTYRSDSEFSGAYGKFLSRKYKYYFSMKNDEDGDAAYQRILKAANSKKKLVAWLVSNCNADSKRELYVRELKKYIEVDVFGKCGQRCVENCEEAITSQYLFYLAFENSVCSDYITEKFWRMDSGSCIVPIVLKADLYYSVAPTNNSFIAADDFESPKELAEYLIRLANNRTEYNEFLEWHRHYWIPNHPSMLENAFCDLCTALHNKSRAPKYYSDIVQYWFNNSGCIPNYAATLVD